MELSITVKHTEPGVVTILPAGSIDSNTYEQLEQKINEVLAEPLDTLILDLAGVTFITSSGVGTIVKARETLNKNDRDLATVNAQPQVWKVFEIMSLLPTLNVFESTKELDEYLTRVQRRMTGQED
ncbi:MAG: STAS domain-containing protein [Planctomycetota bacterium]|jgi:anti-anti-sigma factor